MPNRLPLEIRGVAPGPGFTHQGPRPRPAGLPEGVHTGGIWVSPDGVEFWKPLDGRPYVNANCHYPTEEAEILEVMAGAPGFPRNWRVEECGSIIVDGRTYTRRWLVRRKAYPLPCEDVPVDVDRHARPIERGLRLLNRRSWTIGDRLAVAYDTDLGEPFVLDLSCAWNDPKANDEDRFLRWAEEEMGFQDLVQLRKAGREAVSIDNWLGDPHWPRRAEGNGSGDRIDTRYRHVYASRLRPMDTSWARIPGAYFKPADYGRLRVHTWVIVPTPLDEETVQQYELEWAWGPLERNDVPLSP